MPIKSSERAIALITAFDLAITTGDIGGQIMLDIVDEMSNKIADAPPEECDAARDELFGVIVSLVGILHGALSNLDGDIDKCLMMQNSAQEAHRRAMIV